MVREKYKAPMGWGYQSARAAGIRHLKSCRSPRQSGRAPSPVERPEPLQHPHVERSGEPRNSSQPQMCEEIQEPQEKKETPGGVVC